MNELALIFLLLGGVTSIWITLETDDRKEKLATNISFALFFAAAFFALLAL